VTSPLDPGSVQGNAYDLLQNMLQQWGLESLAPDVLGFLQQGYSQDQVSFKLQDTDAYKQRFAGNETRRKQGLPVLSPADYLNTEASYRQIMQSAGLPSGFYDQPSDFADWIGNDVSPTEINSRVSTAVEISNKLDPGLTQSLKDWYGVQPNDVAAYILDQQRALPAIQNIARAAEIGGVANDNNAQITQQRAEQLARQSNLTNPQLTSAEGQAIQTGRTGSFLGEISGLQYDQSVAENELFLDDAEAARRRKELGNLEQGRFTGGSVKDKSQLAQPSAKY
jgi:hypothetical protein